METAIPPGPREANTMRGTTYVSHFGGALLANSEQNISSELIFPKLFVTLYYYRSPITLKAYHIYYS